jgi:hypothetical protein
MRYIFFAFILFSLISLQSFAQIIKPAKRKFNVGISTALGGLNFSFFPSVDISYKNTMFKVSPGFMAFSAGVSHEIKPVSEAFYNVKWVVSAYYSYGSYKGLYARNMVSKLDQTPDNVSRGILLTGIRIYFGKRWYSSSQIGIEYSNFRSYTHNVEARNGNIFSVSVPGSTSLIPYVEFGIGFNIFKTYPTADNISY